VTVNRSAVNQRPAFVLEGSLLLLILAVGIAARFYQLDHLPPGLYADEAWYALDAVDVINGARPVYFPANNGREPLFIYVLAASINVLGHSPLALRLPAAVFGSLNVLTAYALGRALFNSRIGLLMAALCAVSVWAIALSRIGLRATTLPAFGALMLACTIWGWKTRRVWLIALGGALCGLCLYTYISARLIPFILIAFGVWWYSARRLGPKQATPQPPLPWKELAAFVLPAVLVFSPLAAYALAQPEIYLGRVGQVSILAAGWGALFDNFLKVLAMFVITGDPNARHNIPGRPVFDPVLGAACVIGVGLGLYRGLRQRDSACALTLLWCGTMLLPSLLSDAAPHFLRAIGALPMIFVFPALALEAVWRWRRGSRWAQAAIVLAVTVSGWLNVRDYFGPYASDQKTRLAFEDAVVALATELKTGIQSEAETIYVEERYWHWFPVTRFLISNPARLQLFAGGAPLKSTPAIPVTLITQAIDNQPATLSSLPTNGLITIHDGLLYFNEANRSIFPFYVTYRVVQRPVEPREYAAKFESGVALVSAEAHWEGRSLRASLIWTLDGEGERLTDIHSYLHLRQADNTIVAQADEPLGTERYPLRVWRAGDWIKRDYTLDLPAEIDPATLHLFTGLYTFPALDRVKLREGSQAEYAFPSPRP
jgi:4-amino-4-deoxy-L-arabinose transferase-like glycosyltransferase